MVLLFTQLATAAYACPQTVADILGATRAATAMAAEMPGCDGSMSAAMDPDQPQLCKAHCDPGAQTVNPNAPTSPADVASPQLLAVLDWRPLTMAPQLTDQRATQMPPGASPPGSAPLYLCLLVLRN